MKKLSISFTLVVLLILATVASALALEPVSYDDTNSNGMPEAGDLRGSLIENGDFKNWTDGMPDNWMLSETAGKTGWDADGAHVAKMDYSRRPGSGFNDALGLFVRNTGGSGPFYAYASNKLSRITTAGNYWINIHTTAWGENRIPYNEGAWYAISSQADPSMVDSSAWRELRPNPMSCPNGWEICNHLGRYETVSIAPGDYLHLRAGHKFNVFNAWTVFGFDDISIVPADPAVEAPLDGWQSCHVAEWVNNRPRYRCHTVTWYEGAPR